MSTPESSLREPIPSFSIRLPRDGTPPQQHDPAVALRLIGSALSAGYDLDETLQVVADLTAQITGGFFTRILISEDQVTLVAHAGSSQGIPLHLPPVPKHLGLAGEAMSTKSIVVSQDVGNDARAVNQEVARKFGIKGNLIIPLVYDNQAIGVLSVGWPGPPNFSDDDLTLLAAFADQAAVAVERARLRKAEQEQLAVVTDLLAAANSIGAALDLPSVMARLRETTMRLIGCQRCTIWLLDEASDQMVIAYPPGAADEQATVCRKLGIPMDEVPYLGKVVLETRSTAIVEDATVSTIVPPALSEALNVGALMDVPIMVGDRVLGMIGINFRLGPHRFTRREQAIAEGLANLAGIAIEHARTVARWEEAKLADERGRLAREVHDTLGQELVAIGSRIDLCRELLDTGETARCVEELDATREVVTVQIQDVRRAIAGLRPLELEKYGFVSALQRYVDAFVARSGLEASLTVRGDRLRMPAEAELVLYRVSQEALNNARRHAHAAHVNVTLDVEMPEIVRLTITDDGNGKAPGSDSRADGRGGVGLVLMRERVQTAGGELQVTRVPGKGTTVSVSLPRSPQ